MQNNDEKKVNKNRMQPKEISRKNNLNINCPSFFPVNLKKYYNSNDTSDDKVKQVSIGLNEYIKYFNFSEEYQHNEEDINNNLRNIPLNKNAKEYIPMNKRVSEDSEKIGYMEMNTNSIEQNQNNKKENSQNDDYSYLDKSKKINFILYSDYSHSSKSSSSTNINVSIESWAKNDFPKEYEEVEDSEIKENTNDITLIKKELNELLNLLKKDNGQNGEKIKIQIFEIIKNKNNYQSIFIEVFFYRVCMDSTKVEIYAKLFKNLDKELLQKYKVKEEGKRISSKFRTKLIEKCQKVFKGEIDESFMRAEEPNQKITKLKKMIIGNIIFMAELIKIKMLSKKIVPNCINYLLNKYKNEKDKVLKNTHAVAIIIFIEKFEEIIHSGDKNMNKEEFKKILKELELIKNDEEKHIKHMITKLIEKNKSEKNILANSSKESEEEFKGNNKDKKLNVTKEEEINQEYINEKINDDLINYKEYFEKNGNSKDYPWNITTNLYDIKFTNFEDIIEGYILACSHFIEKENNIKYAEDYIKELVEYYHDKINSEEKKQLLNKIFDLFERVNDFALTNLKIYNIYAYVIYLFIVNQIIDIKSLENIIKGTNMINKKDLISISIVYNNVYNYIQNDIFKNTLKKFVFIDRNKSLFEWVFKNSSESEIVKNN